MSVEFDAEAARFHFDTLGYVFIKGALTADDCVRYRDAVNRLEQQNYPDKWFEHPDIKGKGLPTLQKGGTSRRLNGLPRLDTAFDDLIDHPVMMARLNAFMQKPQLVNTWSISKDKGEGWGGWHRGVPQNGYSVVGGKVNSIMLNTIWFLTDNGPDDGCVTVIPGSHKANFDIDLYNKYSGDKAPGHVRVVGEPGDLLMFSETLLHTGAPKTTDGVRTNLYFNYIEHTYNPAMREFPTNHANMHHYWFPASLRERFTESQRELTWWMDWMKWEQYEA